MFIYLITFLLLLFCVGMELFSKIPFKNISKICFLFLAGLFICRYGQGTDYFSYELIYDVLPTFTSFSPIKIIKELNSLPTHSEIGWKLLCVGAKTLSLSFTQFVIVLSIVEVWLLRRFIKIFCPYPLVALFLIFPTIYMTYMFSLLRQSIVLLFFLAILLPLLLKRKTGKYLLGCLFLLSIHRTAFVLFPAPFLLRIKYNKGFHLLVVGSYVLGTLLWMSGLTDRAIMGQIATNISYDETGVSVIAILERICTYCFMIFLFAQYQKNQLTNDKMPFLTDCMKLYAYGMMLYGIFYHDPLWASRFGILFKALEIPLCCHFVRLPKLRMLFCSYFIPLGIFMYFKNINSYILQGCYTSTINIFNYPYISIFNASKIFWIRWIQFNWPT